MIDLTSIIKLAKDLKLIQQFRWKLLRRTSRLPRNWPKCSTSWPERSSLYASRVYRLSKNHLTES